jgi:ribosomal protein S18 acetylase RimI-like enzyme
MDHLDAVTTPDGRLAIAQAAADDVDAAAAIEEDAARWVRSQGIDPGVPPRPLRDILTECAARGELFLARLDNEPVAKLVLQWADPRMWGDFPGEAGYVHGLMVRRAFAGRQIGLHLLRWAERVAALAGRDYLRLDCRADNPALRHYYECAGFVYRGDVTTGSYTGSRYERRVAEGANGPDAL